MAYTLQDVWDEALLIYGLPATDGYLAPIEVRRLLVSKAQRDVASQIDWPELAVEDSFTIADGDESPFTLPASENFLRLKWVYITGDSDVLLPKQRQELLPLEDPSVGTGSRYYAVGSDGLGKLQLWLSPNPRVGKVVRYSYIRKPPALSNPTDQLLIPDHLSEVVVARVCYLIALRKGDMDRAPMLLSEYKDTLAALRDEAIVQRGPTLPKLRGDW